MPAIATTDVMTNANQQSVSMTSGNIIVNTGGDFAEHMPSPPTDIPVVLDEQDVQAIEQQYSNRFHRGFVDGGDA